MAKLCLSLSNGSMKKNPLQKHPHKCKRQKERNNTLCGGCRFLPPKMKKSASQRAKKIVVSFAWRSQKHITPALVHLGKQPRQGATERVAWLGCPHSTFPDASEGSPLSPGVFAFAFHDGFDLKQKSSDTYCNTRTVCIPPVQRSVDKGRSEYRQRRHREPHQPASRV